MSSAKTDSKRLFEKTVENLRKLFDEEAEMKEEINGSLLNIEERFSKRKNKCSDEQKMFNDSVHGHVELHPLLVKIMDTPQFQRLRYIKQLGAGYWVYPGASHNRFEHCIGVAYLAGCLVKSLQEKQPELHITDRDKLCVQIAGLCHDLGHGPFSHMFDNMFIPESQSGKKLKHEDLSVKMFYHMINEDNQKIKKEMMTHGLKEEDMVFIEELIKGVDITDKWTHKGRSKDKSFLYEIVSNKRNGIDVDKWDYFARDCHHLGISKSFDHQRLLKLTRVCEVDGTKYICFRDKEKDNIYDMFCTRYNLHRQAYQHKTVNIIEFMIKEALLKADNHLQISNSINDMAEYTKLTDHVLEKILYPDFDPQILLEDTRSKLQSAQTNPENNKEILEKAAAKLKHIKEKMKKDDNCITKAQEIIADAQNNPVEAHETITSCLQLSEDELPKARKILEDIVMRRLPKFVKEARIPDHMEKEDLNKSWKTAVNSWNEPKLDPEHFVIDIIKIDYGMKGKDLTENVYFYNKCKPSVAFKIKKDEMTSILPDRFHERLMRVYYKGSDDQVFKGALNCFEKFCQDNFRQPEAGAL